MPRRRFARRKPSRLSAKRAFTLSTRSTQQRSRDPASVHVRIARINEILAIGADLPIVWVKAIPTDHAFLRAIDRIAVMQSHCITNGTPARLLVISRGRRARPDRRAV